MLNKKEAIAYAQITLNYMQSSKYDGEINSDTFAIEMKQAFKLYPRNIVVNIAKSQVDSMKTIQEIEIGSDISD